MNAVGRFSAQWRSWLNFGFALFLLSWVSSSHALNQNLSIAGNYSFQVTGNQVYVTVDKINNSSSTYTSGSLRLELWATTTPYAGSGISGQKTASIRTVNISGLSDSLGPTRYFYGIGVTMPFTAPPSGYVYYTLILSEYSLPCTAADHFCIAAYGSFSNNGSTSGTTGTGGGTVFDLAPSWNLLGNSSSSPISVATTFGDAAKIATVWKWNRAASKWAFYAPSLAGQALTDYATGKGYDVLTSIAPKEGFWVNASTAVSLTGPVAGGVKLAESDLQQGWNLVGSADNKTPSQLNQGLGSSLNTAGKAMVTAWAWDAPNTKWKFYAPSLEAQGGTALADYIAAKGYLPFSTALSASDGFWLNLGTASSAPPPTVTGIVATGKPLGNAQITLTDAKGVTRTTTSSVTGSYTIDITGLSAPLVVKATGLQGTVSITLVSVVDIVVVSSTNIINITPLTTAIAAMLSSTGRAIDLDPVKDGAKIISSLTTVEIYITILIAPTLTDAGLASDADPITTPFVADGTGYDSIYDNLQVGQTSAGTIYFGPRCTPEVVRINGHCTEYSDPGDQTTTNPNLCGFDIATGAGIPCDPTQPINAQPSVTLPLIGPDDVAGGFAISGPGVHFGPSDTPPPPNPLRLVTVPCIAGTSGCLISGGSLPIGFPTNVTTGTYVIAGQVCATLVGCISIPPQTIQNTDINTFANTVVSAFQAGAASAGSSGCSQSQSYTPFNGSSFSGTLTTTCTSGGQSASSTVTLTITKQ